MRWRRQVRPDKDRPTITCAACGEPRPHAAHGWCQACYCRWKNHGRPQDGPPAKESLQPCGTNAAYQRHVKNGEPVDDGCRGAHNTDQNLRRAKARSKAAIRDQWTDEQARAARAIAVATSDSPSDRRLLLEAMGLAPAQNVTDTEQVKAA
jgi:hypothetical protein